MSASTSAGHNVWDEDWEQQADTPTEKKVSSKVTKAQRRAQQAEFNRQLWAEAEQPQTLHFLETQSNVPLKQEFKPTVTVLSRKPQASASRSAATPSIATAGMARLALVADDKVEESDEEDEKNKAPEPTPEERQAIAMRSLEERQRKYEEVRERLFGSPSANTSGTSTPRSATPPTRQNEGRGKGKSRGGGRDNNKENHKEKRDSSSTSSKSRQLYDPGNAPRSSPNYVQRKDNQSPGERVGGQQQSPRQPYRHPRGPDVNGRGGFKPRGAKTT
ncbi:uncharacterized protein EURHEDRAFT_532678 [Aspergillus ruber CBS 135680]|uniref:Uncharacterized protein n=1 Tax=Aspergillus ruber (strain CBS 135680) TaxID=1388766 RepID=A0A017S6U8_ASPRC|nr:uncharacterized protein EURHEDRAFT_532678 [Aspergillus ruber CBS 135680]EYE92677.1 hypothetical protein EURHEDRAFT_532678 [Aspergillus ruber CBS 135680]